MLSKQLLKQTSHDPFRSALLHRVLLVCLSGSSLWFSGCTSLSGLQGLPGRERRSNAPHQAAVARSSDLDGKVTSAVVPVSYEAVASDASFASCAACGGECGGTCGNVTSDDACNACSGCLGGSECVTCTAPASVRRNTQEYIFDGGDQQPQVVVREDWSAVGVDPSDTVIYYETLGGQVCVKASNRVPIYAPRFGAVRQVSGLRLAQRAVGTERFLTPVVAAGMQENNGPTSMVQPLAPLGEQQVRVLDGFQELRGGVPVAQVLPPLRMSDAVKPVENLTFFTTGLMQDEEIPVLGRVLQNAREWFTPESIEVEVQGVTAGLVLDAKRAQDVHVYEMPEKCAMRICKAASHSVANSGDIIRFTIRFDNVGPKPLGNAVIMDSLVARLEYIEGSQQCSVDCNFSASPNDVGSSVLRCEIEDSIAPGTGGVISFDCRVR